MKVAVDEVPPLPSKARAGVSQSITELRSECHAISKAESRQNRNKTTSAHLSNFGNSCGPSAE